MNGHESSEALLAIYALYGIGAGFPALIALIFLFKNKSNPSERLRKVVWTFCLYLGILVFGSILLFGRLFSSDLVFLLYFIAPITLILIIAIIVYYTSDKKEKQELYDFDETIE